MSRNINIFHHNNQSQKMPGFYNLEINSIDQELVNYSNNLIYCGCLEYIGETYIEKAIDNIFKKIRINGSLVVSFTNYKDICLAYSNSLISDKQFIDSFVNKQAALSSNTIKNIIKNIPGAIISRIENIENENKTVITIVRNSL